MKNLFVFSLVVTVFVLVNADIKKYKVEIFLGDEPSKEISSGRIVFFINEKSQPLKPGMLSKNQHIEIILDIDKAEDLKIIKCKWEVVESNQVKSDALKKLKIKMIIITPINEIIYSKLRGYFPTDPLKSYGPDQYFQFTYKQLGK